MLLVFHKKHTNETIKQNTRPKCFDATISRICAQDNSISFLVCIAFMSWFWSRLSTALKVKYFLISKLFKLEKVSHWRCISVLFSMLLPLHLKSVSFSKVTNRPFTLAGFEHVTRLANFFRGFNHFPNHDKWQSQEN